MTEDEMAELLYHLLIQPPQSSKLALASTELVHAINGNYVRVVFPDGRRMSVVPEYY